MDDHGYLDMRPGSNVQRLLIERTSQLMVERAKEKADAQPFSITANVAAEMASGAMSSVFREAHDWVKAAIRACRMATPPNPFTGLTDEQIAGEIMRRVEERKAEQAAARKL